MKLISRLLALALALGAAACGGSSGGSPDGGTPDDANGTVDAKPTVDAAVPPGCTGPDTTKPQCSNCIDDDNDGFIDSFDLECTGPLDDLESSFATGIPGDNMDTVKQDCFFDGNSGAGGDRCEIHVCCLLGATTQAMCPVGQNQYDPAECPPPIGNRQLSQECRDECGALTPPGCDCFGCCTLCDPNNPSQCYDIATSPATSPNCTSANLNDPNVCKRCTKVPSCGDTQCGGDTCILCPGQTADDLPPGCNGTSQCPTGSQSCAMGETCPAQTYCDASAGCCVGVVL